MTSEGQGSVDLEFTLRSQLQDYMLTKQLPTTIERNA